MKMDIDEKDVLDSAALDTLYRWIDMAEVTRPKKNLARDFSDGVPVAEVVNHYMPRTVDLHNYVVASSSAQKKVNWTTLNRRIFTGLKMKLTEDQINQVVDAKPGAIEQVLWNLRQKISENPMIPTYSTKKAAPCTKIVSSSGYAQSHNPVKTLAQLAKSNIGLKAPASTLQLNRRASRMMRPQTPGTAMKLSSRSKTRIVSKPEVVGATATATAAGKPEEDAPKLYSSESGNLKEAPSEIVFRGHKMVSVELLEAKDKENKELETTKRQLSTKITRLDRMVTLKEERITDLTYQLTNLRTMYESATKGYQFAQSEQDANNNV